MVEELDLDKFGAVYKPPACSQRVPVDIQMFIHRLNAKAAFRYGFSAGECQQRGDFFGSVEFIETRRMFGAFRRIGFGFCSLIRYVYKYSSSC